MKMGLRIKGLWIRGRKTERLRALGCWDAGMLECPSKAEITLWRDWKSDVGKAGIDGLTVIAKERSD
jgi:hypothetical protein